MSSRLQKLADKVCEHLRQDKLGKPAGFFDLQELCRIWGMQTCSAASSRAKMLTIKGLMVRQAYKTGGSTGRHFWSYAYKPAPGLKSIAEVDDRARRIGAEKVPKGWMPALDFCRLYGFSVQAFMQMTYRHNIKARVFKVCRGINQVKPVYHYKVSQMLKFYGARAYRRRS